MKKKLRIAKNEWQKQNTTVFLEFRTRTIFFTKIIFPENFVQFRGLLGKMDFREKFEEF